jgi:[acyl-carrier-protein] S-malonyltransferase
MKVGLIFPGQGSQFVGMAKEFYDQHRSVQDFFEQASSCLDQNFVKLCFASSEKDLKETVNAQTSIFLVSASIVTILKNEYGITPHVVAGHSLGEYSALFAAGGINLVDALYLLKKRGQLMDEAREANEKQTGMLAVLNMPQQQLQEITARYDKLGGNDNLIAEIVNFNSPSQLVVSGTLEELELVRREVMTQGGKAIMLKVAGAFHSRLMSSIEEKLSLYMEKVDFHDLAFPVISNYEARPLLKGQEIRPSLVKQISAPVLWWSSMQYFKDCDIIIEVGPGDKLSTMLKKEWPLKTIVSVNTIEDLNNLLKILGKDDLIKPLPGIEAGVLESNDSSQEIF